MKFRKLVKVVFLSLLILAPSSFFGQYSVPVSTGAIASSGSLTYATVRCSTSQVFTTGTSDNITFPSCATAGDLIIVFISTQNHVTVVPSGWFALTQNFTTSYSYITGGAIYKQLTSSDVSTGYVTLTTIASGTVSTATVEFVGLPAGGTSSGESAIYLNTNTTALTIAAPTSTGIVAGDTVFYFGSNNGTGPVTVDRGSPIQTTTGSVPSVLSAEQISTSSTGLTPTFTYTGYTTQGVFNEAIVVHGGMTYTPEAIPGLELWVSADCITRSSTTCSTPANGTTINTSGWVNRYGAIDINNTSITGTCTFNTNVVNGLPAVNFNACALSIGTTPTISGAYDSVTMAAAWQNTSTAAKGTLIGSDNLDHGPAYWTCASSKQQGIDSQGSVQEGSGTAACDTVWHYGIGIGVNGSYPTFWLDGASDATINGTTGTFSSTVYAIGRNNSGTEYLSGNVGELLLYRGQLTASQIAILNTYLSRW